VSGLKQNPRTVAVASRQRALLDYVIQLTEAPWDVTEDLVVGMRSVGYSNEAIAAANFITGFFAWCNRVIDGLGVPLEDYWDEDVRAREEAVKRNPPGSTD